MHPWPFHVLGSECKMGMQATTLFSHLQQLDSQLICFQRIQILPCGHYQKKGWLCELKATSTFDHGESVGFHLSASLMWNSSEWASAVGRVGDACSLLALERARTHTDRR